MPAWLFMVFTGLFSVQAASPSKAALSSPLKQPEKPRNANREMIYLEHAETLSYDQETAADFQLLTVMCVSGMTVPVCIVIRPIFIRPPIHCMPQAIVICSRAIRCFCMEPGCIMTET
jgi:hypothetical protein